MGTYVIKTRRFEKKMTFAFLSMIISSVFLVVVVLAADMQLAMAIDNTGSVVLKLHGEIQVWLYDTLAIDTEIGGYTTGEVEPQLDHA